MLPARMINSKRYVDNYTLLVTINKNDEKAEFLKKMARGMITCFELFAEAAQAQKEFLNDAHKVLGSNLGGDVANFSTYGIICILDNRECEVLDAVALKG